MNEIKKRMGELRIGSQSSDDFWARTYADRFNVRPGGGNDYSQIMRGVEIGKDNPRAFTGGKKYTGFVLGTGRADSTYSSGGSGKYDNKGLGLSAEIGRRFERGNGVFIEPATELSALWAGHASYTTANGMAVETPAERSLQLRLGVTAGRKWKDSDGASRQFYGKVSWVNEYAGDSTTRVDNAAFDSSLKGHQWVAGLGWWKF